MNRKEVFKIVSSALNEYYEKRYNEYINKNDRNNAMYITLEAVDVRKYVEENLR